jgi:hypothetical protein
VTFERLVIALASLASGGVQHLSRRELDDLSMLIEVLREAIRYESQQRDSQEEDSEEV